MLEHRAGDVRSAWGEYPALILPRPEYPRPQFRRETWINLNGPWRFAFDDDDRGLDWGWQRTPADRLGSSESPFDRCIVVPFCVQSRLSGIGDTGFHDIVWYARTFTSPHLPPDGRLLLHFGAVDYQATVWLNGEQVAEHEGGHTPFEADITRQLLRSGEEHVLFVRVEDAGRDRSIPRGKQAWTEGSEHIFYTRTTGIWQTVWLEVVSRRHIGGLRLTPDLDEACLDAEVSVERAAPGLALRLTVHFAGELIREIHQPVTSSCTVCRIDLDSDRPVAPWSPELPNLYDLRVELLSADGEPLDVVESYFGLRKVETRGGKVFLNNAPCYQRLVLDQGYFPDGILTAPTDADLRKDIELARAMGFNGARKHQKVEDPRWLYWADRLGFLVWGEMANAYEYSTAYVRRITAEWTDVLLRDHNHPCIVAWVPMNESAGGRLVGSEPLRVEHLLALYHLTRSLDRTRPVVSNDGWEHALSDLCTLHDYGGPAALARRYETVESSLAVEPLTMPPYADGHVYRGEPILITEFGGILWGSVESGLGYAVAASGDEFVRAYGDLIDALLASDVVEGFCYTQLTDVEQEVNGLLTADRRPKVDIDRIRAITTRTRPGTLPDRR